MEPKTGTSVVEVVDGRSRSGSLRCACPEWHENHGKGWGAQAGEPTGRVTEGPEGKVWPRA